MGVSMASGSTGKAWILHGLLIGAAIAAAAVAAHGGFFRLLLWWGSYRSRVIGIILTRLASLRFQGKPLVQILEKPMIQSPCDFQVLEKEDSPVINSHEFKALFQSQQRHLNYFFDNLNLDHAQAFAQTLLDAPGSIFFSGVGKSGLVALKLSQTLTSLGFTQFFYLPPVDALHGDIGELFPSDILILISKSGSSDELLNLIPCARAKGARLISITSVEGNPLATFCDINIHLPLEREVCPFNLAPLTSFSIQMVFGDMVVAAIMRARKLTKENYARNHPVGKIRKSPIFKFFWFIERMSSLSSPCDFQVLEKEDAPVINRHELKTVFESQQRHLNYFFNNLNLDRSQAFAQTLLDTPGAIFFSGIGKSDFVALKLSKSLASFGFSRSTYLPLDDALHGNIGALCPSDILILISKSGSSDELLNLVPCAKAKGVQLISITSVEGNPLATLCDVNVHLPLEGEVYQFGLTPLTSSAIQIVFGDTVMAAIMRARKLTKENYLRNHPAGKIGKSLIFKVKDLMKKQEELPLCKETDMIMDQLTELTSKGCGCLLVVNAESQLIGTFTDGDLRRTLKSSGERIFKLTVGEMCNRNPRTITPEEMAVGAKQKMESPPSAVQFLPVVNDQRVVLGIITLHGLVSAGL